jgi:hypothetical protein
MVAIRRSETDTRNQAEHLQAGGFYGMGSHRCYMTWAADFPERGSVKSGLNIAPKVQIDAGIGH